MAISKITLNGVTQIDLTSDTVTASKLFDDYTAHGADGTVVTGSYVAPTARTSSDVTVNGATVTVPVGAYSSQVQKSVASGTAGTPTASKGAVNNHSIAVTPSVTNTTGYITGSTINGTAVTVSASELVSGDKSITQNGSNIDVAEYSTVTVNVSGGGGGASNLVHGTFTTGSTRGAVGNTTVNYSGNGYPVAAVVFIKGGAYNNTTGGNADWVNLIAQYDVGTWYMTKSRVTTAPTYADTDIDNCGATTIIRKNSSTNAGSFTGGFNIAANVYKTSSQDPSSGVWCVGFKASNTTLAWYVGNSSSSAVGLTPSTEYEYYIVYSQ